MVNHGCNINWIRIALGAGDCSLPLELLLVKSAACSICRPTPAQIKVTINQLLSEGYLTERDGLFTWHETPVEVEPELSW